MTSLPSNISFGLSKVMEWIAAKGYSSIAVLVDENTRAHCYPVISPRLAEHHVIEISAGETHKNLETCRHIWSEMTAHAMDRKSLLINLGGGVIGDMGGFCAATFKRGIDFINLPTTLLSQVDASVGGKLGIDFEGLKNHIGLFTDPVHIAIHPGFLSTLPAEELRSGFAEVIKHHLIRDKEGWVKLVKSDWKELNWENVIPHSVAIKSEVVKEDPYENGVRKILNLGHTIGHAIESHLLASGRPVLHGEAVAAGIICENYIAGEKGLLSAAEKSTIESYILSLYGKINVPEREFPTIVQQAVQDKKNEQKRIRAVLLAGIGDPRWDVEITAAEILDSLTYYESHQTP